MDEHKTWSFMERGYRNYEFAESCPGVWVETYVCECDASGIVVVARQSNDNPNHVTWIPNCDCDE